MAMPSMLRTSDPPRVTRRNNNSSSTLNRKATTASSSPSGYWSALAIRLVWFSIIPLSVYIWTQQAQVLQSNRDFYRHSPSSSTVSSSSSSQQVELSSLKPVAYVISLIKCGDHQSNVGGLVDAATILAYSVHRTSVRNQPRSSSKYDYKLYAIVHQQAVSCSDTLQHLGYEILIRDSPVKLDEIQDETLRKQAPQAWCCGEKEFVKLYAYTLLQHDIVVHVDIDFAFAQPLDDLYDAMLYQAYSPQGQVARSKIVRERPDDAWPPSGTIEAFITRDWGQVIPGRKPGYQAGFVIIRPSMEIFEQILNTIRTSEYDGGFSRENGWGRKGYGGFVGAAAMQGLMAYFYDEIRPNTTVELNQCRYNHMGMDVLYRAPPSFMPKHAKVGQCRNDLDSCEDCQITPLDQIYNIHYTQCRKPWTCTGQGSKEVGKGGIPEDNVVVEHCLQLSQLWNEYRTELEDQLFQLTKDDTIRSGQIGSYMPDVFKGHCKAYGSSNYLPISGKPETLRRIHELFAPTVPVTS